MSTTNSGAISIYHLGGVGTKIAAVMKDTWKDKLIPPLNRYFIDCSSSEDTLLKGSDDAVMCKIQTKGPEGSGGVRSTNYEAIADQTPILLDSSMPSEDINFIVFSSTGASGNTLAFVLLKELLNEGKSVMCFITNTPDTLSRAANASKTLLSLHNLAKEMGVALPCMLYDTTNTSYGDSDSQTVRDMMLSAGMLNNQIVSMDGSDRRNFLNPTNMPDADVKPGLYEIKMFSGYNYTGTAYPIAVMTLALPGTSDNIGSNAPNLFGGILSEEFQETFLSAQKDSSAISMVMSAGTVAEFLKALNAKIDDLKKTSKLNSAVNDVDLTDSISAENKGGLIL